MLRHKCECGSVEFYANRKKEMLCCVSCKKRVKFTRKTEEGGKVVLHEGKWFEYKLPFKEKVKEVIEEKKEIITEQVNDFAEEIEQKWKEWREKFEVKKYKKKNEFEKIQKEFKIVNKIEAKRKFNEQKIKDKWAFVINTLERKSSVRFENTFHLGKLRGRDAAKACHRDLNRIGIRNKLKFTGNRSAKIIAA